MKVITVTFNPFLQRTLVVHYFKPGYEHLTTTETRLDAAGRGVNISRALAQLGMTTHAIILLGNDPTSGAYQSLIQAEAFPKDLIMVGGRTRSHIVILDTGSKIETLIRDDNAGFSPDSIDHCEARIKALIEPGDIVVYAGPLPRGIDDTRYLDLLHVVKDAGARVVLDLPNPALREAIKAKPSLVYVSQQQVESYFNFPVRTPEMAASAARMLLEQGAANVIMSLTDVNGDQGVLLKTTQPDATYTSRFSVQRIGTQGGKVGGLLAGYLYQQVLRQPEPAALKFASAMALSVNEQVGNKFPTPAMLTDYLSLVDVIEGVTSEIAAAAS